MLCLCFSFYSRPCLVSIMTTFSPKGLFYGFTALSGEIKSSPLCWSQIDNDLSGLVSTLTGLPGGIDFIAVDILTAACISIGTDAMWSTRLQSFSRHWLADLTKIAVPPLPIPVRASLSVFEPFCMASMYS